MRKKSLSLKLLLVMFQKEFRAEQNMLCYVMHEYIKISQGLSCTVEAIHHWLVNTFPCCLRDILSRQFTFSFSVHTGGFLEKLPVSSMRCVECYSVYAAWPISRLSPQCAASKCAFPTMVRANKLSRHRMKTMTAWRPKWKMTLITPLLYLVR